MTPAEVLAAAADKLDLNNPGQCRCGFCKRDEALAAWLCSLATTLAGDPSDYCASAGHGSYDGEEACVSWFCETVTHALALARLIIGGETDG